MLQMESNPSRLTGVFDSEADARAAAAELTAAGYEGALVAGGSHLAASARRAPSFVAYLFGGMLLGTLAFGIATGLIALLVGGDSNQSITNSVLGGAFVGAAAGSAGGGLVGGLIGLHGAEDRSPLPRSAVSVDRDDAQVRGILTRHGARFS